MTLLFMDGFDHYTAAQGNRKWVSGPLKVLAPGRFGVGQSAYQDGRGVGSGATMLTPQLGNKQTIIAGFAMNFDSFNAANNILWQFMDGTSSQVELRIDTSGFLYFTRNGTVIGSPSTNPLVVSSWFYLEAKVFIHPSAGTAECRVAENVWVSVTGVNTRTSANNQVSHMRNDIGANQTGRQYDDLYICDNQGTTNLDYLGDCRVETLYPSAAGGQNDWTPSAGSNYQCVDEVTSNDDTDYVSSITVGHRDIYTYGNLVTTGGVVRAIQPVVTARLGNAGARTIAPTLRTAGNDVDGNNKPVLSASYLHYYDIQQVNPSTGLAWTIAEVNAAEFGTKVIA